MTSGPDSTFSGWHSLNIENSDRSGTLIRHAASGTTPAAIVTLTIAMVETSQERLLVSTIGLAMLVSAGLAPASRATVALSPIAVGAKVEDHTTAAGAAEPLSENNFASDRHGAV